MTLRFFISENDCDNLNNLDLRSPHLGNFEFNLVGEDGGERLRGPGEVEVSQVVVQCGGGEDQRGGATCRI